MDDVFTDCLIKMRDDLSQLRHIRECLDSNPESQYLSGCSITWRTIEAYNAVLAKYTADDEQGTQIVKTVLDSLWFIINNNNGEKNVLKNFGFEFGMICVKILSLIEKTKLFNDMFGKILSIIKLLCEHTFDPWKAMARQILNVFINKKLPVASLETSLNLYASVLRRVDSSALRDFAQKNFHLLKTFSEMIQRIGDFEIQSDAVEIILLHVSTDENLMVDFIIGLPSQIKYLFQSLKFENFEDDCRLYLNALNKNAGDRKKITSIECKEIIFGGRSLEPPPGKETLWLDANEATKRLSVKCLDFQTGPPHQCVIFIQFDDIISVRGTFQNITFKVVNLKKILPAAKTDEIACTTSSSQDVFEFKVFVEEFIGKTGRREKFDAKETLKNSQENFEEKKGINRIIPGALSLLSKFEKNSNVENAVKNLKTQSNQDSFLPKTKEMRADDEHSPMKHASPIEKQKTNSKPEELSPNSFVESLNKNLGLESPNVSNSLGSPLLLLSFQKSPPIKNAHRLFQGSENVFEFFDDGYTPENKKSSDLREIEKNTRKTNADPINNSENKNESASKASKSRKRLQLSDTPLENDAVFRGESIKKKMKPILPKLKRKKSQKSQEKNASLRQKEKSSRCKTQLDFRTVEKPSLLDPDGYAFKRWLKPTTSEKSKFWLNKLDKLNKKKKKNSAETFEFTDDSEADRKEKTKKPREQEAKGNKKASDGMAKSSFGTSKKDQKEKQKKTKIPPERKQNAKKQETKKHKNCKKISFLAKENFQKFPIEHGRNATEPGKTTSIDQDRQPTEDVSESCIEDSLKDNEKPLYSSKQNPKPLSANSIALNENRGRIIAKPSPPSSSPRAPLSDDSNSIENFSVKSEWENSDVGPIPERENSKPFQVAEGEDGGEDSPTSKKRPESFADETFLQLFSNKKFKMATPTKPFPPILESRFRFFNKKLKKETDEIINTFNSVTIRLVNRLQRKNAQDIIEYVKRSENADSRTHSPDFLQKIKNIEKVYVYHKSKCQSQKVYESVMANLDDARHDADEWNNKKTTKVAAPKTIKKFHGLVEGLIASKIEKLTNAEKETFQNKLMRCISLLRSDIIEWNDS